LYRQVSAGYADQFRRLVDSSLLSRLADLGLMIPFASAPVEHGVSDDAAVVIKPDRVETISYPYEWCFEQLRDAALATLEIQRQCLEAGFSLKDASAYNIQFHNGKPVFIDTLSFEDLRESEPWRAYRQFCQHFLAPLALAAYVDPRLISLSRVHLDGIPLDLAAAMLPTKAKLNAGLGMHLFLHSKANLNEKSKAFQGRGMGRQAHLALVDSLRRTVSGLQAPTAGTEWSSYYSDNNYSDSAAAGKRGTVVALLNLIDEPVSLCWDFGANNGEYSRLAIERGWNTVAWDVDHGAVSQAYAWSKKSGEARLLPLIQDFANPSPRIGWNSEERESLFDRGPAHVAFALALIHHLAIGNNVPLDSIADFFSRTTKWLVVEFVPKEDSQVQRMLMGREDIFTGYTLDGFERAFSDRFELVRSLPVKDSQRSMHLFRRRG
jgi:hypothetical protein